MGVNFPTSLDTLTNPTATDYLNSPSHSQQHADANDICEALEAKVGIDGSAVTTSHDYKLSEVSGTDKAVGKTATQTLSNKTLESPTINTPTFSAGAVGTADIASGAVTLAKTTNIMGSEASGKEIKYGSSVVTTNASGDATVLFSSSFSTETTTVLAVNGDNTAFGNGTISIISKATNGFNIHCFNSDGSAKASSAVRVNYIAVGY